MDRTSNALRVAIATVMVVAIATAVAACTTSVGDPPAAATATPSPGTQADADSLLAQTALPPGAMRTDTRTSAPRTVGPLCDPTFSATGFWIVDDMSISELSAWLRRHPTPPFTASATSVGSNDTDPGVVTDGGTLEDRGPIDGVRRELDYQYAPVADGSGLLVRVDAVVTPRDAQCARTSVTYPEATQAP